jgi:hypothetical protein
MCVSESQEEAQQRAHVTAMKSSGRQRCVQQAKECFVDSRVEVRLWWAFSISLQTYEAKHVSAGWSPSVGPWRA